MKRHVQEAGVRKYFGADLVELQSEPLKALDAFFAEYGPCIINGCAVKKTDSGGYDVSAGVVALEAPDTEGKLRVMVIPFDGVSGAAMPLYLTGGREAVVRGYGDGKVKPIAYHYRAVGSSVEPSAGTPYLKLTVAGGLRFTDVLQDSAHRFATDTEKEKWNAKASTATATSAADGLMAASDKIKLDGVAVDANNYVHPLSHPAKMITQDAIHRFATDTEKSAWNSKETPGGASMKASAAEENAVRDSNLHRQITGAVMGKGVFRSSDATLLPKDQSHTTLLLFTTPDARPTSGSVTLYNESTDGSVSYGVYVAYKDTGEIAVYMRGVLIASAEVPVATLCCVGLSYEETGRCMGMINGEVTAMENLAYPYAHDPAGMWIGSAEDSGHNGALPSFRMVACRRFNFPMTTAQLRMAYNAGHPEFWEVPDVWLGIQPAAWPTASYTPSQDTWRNNALSMTMQNNVAAANGFSGPFQHWTNGTGGRVSVYNEWRLRNKDTDLNRCQLVEFEYRCDAPLRAATGSKIYGEWEANTGSAKKGSYIAPAGEYTNLDLVGGSGTFLEVRTLRIVTLGCVLNLVPAGLWETQWKDASGQSVDVPYVPAGINPDEVELSHSTDGYPATDAEDREQLLAYSNRYAEWREGLLIEGETARLKAYAEQVGDTALDVSTAYTDEQLVLKQDTIPNIVITNFDTFAPSAVSELRSLANGEFGCFTSYNAAGRPEGSGNNTESYIWTGRITRLKNSIYRLEAMSGISSAKYPQCYTRLYVNDVPADWQADTEYLNSSTDGFARFPSGLMIQWGKNVPQTGAQTATVQITFPQPFVGNPLSMSFSAVDGISGPRIWSFPIKTISSSKVIVDQFRIDTNGITADGCLFFWTAIGMWK